MNDRYVSHKEVTAKEIAAVVQMSHRTQFEVYFTDKSKIQVVSNAVFIRYMPVKGDFLVTYEDGYISVSPRAAFLAGYKPMTSKQFGIGEAVKQMQDGRAVRRAGWNGSGMFIVLMPSLKLPPYNTQGTERKVNDRTAKWIGEDQPLDCQPYIAMFTAAKQWQPGWVCSQADLLAVDWQVVS